MATAKAERVRAKATGPGLPLKILVAAPALVLVIFRTPLAGYKRETKESKDMAAMLNNSRQYRVRALRHKENYRGY